MEKLEIGIIVTFILNFFYKKNLGWRDRSILCVVMWLYCTQSYLDCLIKIK
jgi:hypothetical protein